MQGCCLPGLWAGGWEGTRVPPIPSPAAWHAQEEQFHAITGPCRKTLGHPPARGSPWSCAPGACPLGQRGHAGHVTSPRSSRVTLPWANPLWERPGLIPARLRGTGKADPGPLALTCGSRAHPRALLAPSRPKGRSLKPEPWAPGGRRNHSKAEWPRVWCPPRVSTVWTSSESLRVPCEQMGLAHSMLWPPPVCRLVGKGEDLSAPGSVMMVLVRGSGLGMWGRCVGMLGKIDGRATAGCSRLWAATPFLETMWARSPLSPSLNLPGMSLQVPQGLAQPGRLLVCCYARPWTPRGVRSWPQACAPSSPPSSSPSTPISHPVCLVTACSHLSWTMAQTPPALDINHPTSRS